MPLISRPAAPHHFLSRSLFLALVLLTALGVNLPSSAQTPASILALNAGGSAASPFGADADYSSGSSTYSVTKTITTTGITNPAPQAVYQSDRLLNGLTYTLPGLTAGAPYTLRLHFSENSWTAAGIRQFNVSVNGTQVLTNFDIFATAGAANKAVVESFPVTANSSGQIVVVFTNGAAGTAMVNGLEVLGTPPGSPTGLTATGGNGSVSLSWTAVTGATGYNVYRATASAGPFVQVNSSGIPAAAYTDTGLTNGTPYYYLVTALSVGGESATNSSQASATPTGLVAPIPARVLALNAGGSASSPFAADADYSSGTTSTYSVNTAINTTGITNPAPQAVYQTDRLVNGLTYTLPGLTAGAPYTLRLHFSENSWTAAAIRQFNVSVNGTQVLTNFDIFATAGAANKAVVESFPAIANGSGQILVAFTNGAAGTAMVNGLEVLGTPPAAPTGLTATAGNGNVSLNWTAVTGATGYNVYRATASAGPFVQVNSAAVTGASYTDTSLTNGTTYYYVVTAVNTSGESGNSNPASATPSAVTPNFSVSASPTSLSVPQGTSQTTTVSLSNTGGFNGSVALTASGLPTGVTAAFAPASISGTTTSTLTLTAIPTATVGTTTVTITGTSGSTTHTATVSLAVTANPILTSIAASPATASLPLNGSQTFTATAKDQSGTALTTQPTFTWSVDSGGVGSITSAGVYSAGAAAGSATVRATSGSVSGTATVTVTNATPTVATAAAASPSPAVGTTAALSVLGADDGGEANLTYTWATTGTPPAAVTFSANGTNAAKSTTATFTKAGSYSFQVTITDAGSKSITSAVTVVVNQTLTSIAVSPNAATLTLNGTQAFTAAAQDQFGTALTTQPTIAWTVVSGGVGTITSAGVYSAGATAGSATVRATSGTVSGTASVTVAFVPPPSPPTNIYAYQSGTGINITCAPSTATFNVYRGTSSGGPYTLMGSSSSSSSYSDTTTAVGTFYYYVVTSVSTSGSESSYSNEANGLVLTGTVSPDIPAPGWADETIPMDEADADGAGPSGSNSVNLASGTAEHHPGPDLVVYNPVGPSPSYERMYRSALAGSGHASPGLSTGWTDNYDLTVQAAGIGTYTLRYPNGAVETWSAGAAAGTLMAPSGAPYLVTSAAGTFSMTFKDHSKFTFALNPNHSSSGVYWLTQMTNLVGHSVSISRDGLDRLVSVSNDASPATVLLSFSYSNTDGTLSSITGVSSSSDPQPRQVFYMFGQAGNPNITQNVLLKVSRLNAPLLNIPLSSQVRPLWQYGYYLGANAQPYLYRVAVADPVYPDSAVSSNTGQSVSYFNYSGSVVTGLTDANNNNRLYRYGSGMAVVQVTNGNTGKLVQQWLQTSDPSKSNVDSGSSDANNNKAVITHINTPSPYLPDSLINRNKQKTSVSYDPTSRFGNVATVTDPRNAITSIGYDSGFPLGQINSVQTGSLAASTSDYYANGFINHVYTPMPGMLGGTNTTTYTYDSGGDNLGNLVTVTSPGANGPVTTSYDYRNGYNGYTQAPALGEPLTVTMTGPDALGGTTTTTTYYKYDARGNQIAVIDALGDETDFTYNLADQLTTESEPAAANPTLGGAAGYSAVTTNTYLYVGGPLTNVSITDPLLAPYSAQTNPIRTTDYVYGHEGELLQVGDNPTGVQYTYDSRYRVTSITDDRNSVTTNTYDATGNLTSVVYPNHKATGPFDHMAYSYDADNNLTKRVDGNGVETDYTLDPLDSLLRIIHYPGGQLPDVNFNYDGYGRRIAMSDQSGSKSYTYDDLDNLLTQTTSFTGGPQSQAFTYHYFPDGRRQQMVTPAGSFNYQYDGAGRMSRVVFPWSSSTYNYTYYANGWLQSAMGPSAGTTYAYNARGLVTDLENTNLVDAGSSFHSITYDAVGNRLHEVTNETSDGNYHGFGYSEGSNIAYNNQRTVTGESAYGVGDSNFTGYDMAGNPVTGNRLQNGFTYNGDNQIIGYNGAGYQFDGNGNPTQYNTQSIVYDPENRPTQIPTNIVYGVNQLPLTVTYDGDGLRATKQSRYGKTYFLYDGSVPVVEENSAGGVTAGNGWGADGWRMRYTSGQIHSYSYDPQGSLVRDNNVTGYFDAFGRQVGSAFYQNPFGPYLTQGPSGFGGQYGYYTDSETGLVLLTHRYYDPGNGRFLTRDPIGYAGGLNLYSLGNYNPVNRSDPLGLWSLYKAIYTGDGNASDEVYNAALNQGAEGLTRWGSHFKQNNIKSFYLILGTTGIAGYPSLPGSHTSAGSELNSSRPGSRALSSQARKMSIRLGQNATKKTITRNLVRGVMKNEAQLIKRTIARNGLRSGTARLSVRAGVGGIALYEAGVSIYSAKQAWDEEKAAPPAKGDEEP